MCLCSYVNEIWCAGGYGMYIFIFKFPIFLVFFFFFFFLKKKVLPSLSVVAAILRHNLAM